MITGLVLTILTGIFWMAVGIIYSRVAGKRLNFTAFMLVYSLAYGIFVCAVRTPYLVPFQEICKLAKIMLPASLLGMAGFLALYMAMKKSSHAVAWSFTQSAMIVPFLGGWLMLGSKVSCINIAGAVLLLTALCLFGRNKAGDSGENTALSGILWSIGSLLLTGLSQFLTLLPGMWFDGNSELLSWRLPLQVLPLIVVWLIALAIRREKIDLSAIKWGILYGVIVSIGQILLYLALDRMQQYQLSNAVYPTAIAMCIILFTVYCRIFRNERFTPLSIAGLLIMLCGMVTILL